MTDLKDRAKAEENFFGHVQEMEFKIKARAYRYTGLWVAQKLDIEGLQEVYDYAIALVIKAFDKSINKPMDEIIEQEFKSKNVEITIFEIRDIIDEAMSKARLEIMGHGH